MEFHSNSTVDCGQEEPYKDFGKYVDQLLQLRDAAVKIASKNIKTAQAQQKANYDNRHQIKHSFAIGQKVWLKNMKCADQKGRKMIYPWTGPFVIANIVSTLEGLKKWQHLCNLKPFVQHTVAEVSPYESLSATLMHPVPVIVRAGLAKSVSTPVQASCAF